MTLLFMDGFDSPSIMPKPEWDVATSWGVTTGRNGTPNHAGVNVSSTTKVVTLPSSAATCIAGAAFNPAGTAPYTSPTVYSFFQFRVGGVVQATLNLDSAGHLVLRMGGPSGGVIATSTNVLSNSTWYHMQVKYVAHTTTGSCEVRLNGVAVINFTGPSANVSGPVDSIGVAGGAIASNVYVDDLWVCDAVDATATQGKPFNDFLGDLGVVSLIPTADVAGSVAWTPSTGTNHAALVDESPPNTTDYVSAAAAGPRDLFDVTDLASTVTGVHACRISAYTQKTDAGAASISPVLKDPTGVRVHPAVPLSTTWAGVHGPLITKKSDGTLFTTADMNAVQIGVDSV